MTTLRKKLIRLAYYNPELRNDIFPLLVCPADEIPDEVRHQFQELLRSASSSAELLRSASSSAAIKRVSEAYIKAKMN